MTMLVVPPRNTDWLCYMDSSGRAYSVCGGLSLFTVESVVVESCIKVVQLTSRVQSVNWTKMHSGGLSTARV